MNKLKRAFQQLGILSLCVFLLAACSSGAGNAVQPVEGKQMIFTSIYPLYNFTQEIAGDKAQVVNLVPSGIEPHDWEPSTSDIANLEKADMLIYNGAGMEHWVDQVLASIENKNLVTVEAAGDVSLLGGETGDMDPHVWLSVKNAKRQAQTIKEALVEADPENAAAYEENYTNFASKLDALDAEYQEGLGELTNRTMIVSHEAFGYLCADYNLTQMGIEGLAGESEPDPARMAEIIRYAKENGVKTIFYEELSSPKAAETIAKEIGGQTAPLNPLEGLTQEQQASGEDYISVMRKNLQTLKQALG